MNTEKPTRIKVCSCGKEFEVVTKNQRSCPACIEAKKAYEAVHPRPLRACSDCGVETRDRDHGRCRACAKAYYAKIAQDWRESKKRDKEERKQQPKPTTPPPPQKAQEYQRGAFTDWFNGLSDEEQERALAKLRKAVDGIMSNLKDIFEIQEDSNPEQTPADNQASIDSDFRDLMDGVL